MTEKQRERDLAEADEREIIGWLMGDWRGRKFVYEILDYNRVFASTFNKEPTVAAFYEGMRNAGLTVLSKIMMHAEDQYIVMCKENSNKENH